MSTTAAKQQAPRVSFSEFYDRTWITRTFGGRSKVERGRPKKPFNVHFVSSIIGWNTPCYDPGILTTILSDTGGRIGKFFGRRGETRKDVFLYLYHRGNYGALVMRLSALNAGIPKPRVLTKWLAYSLCGSDLRLP
jgi:hypothetical protein